MSRAAIEEDYAKRLTKLSKTTLGRDEIGDTAASLQNVLLETAQQATYHQSLSTEIKQTVEQPTAEFQRGEIVQEQRAAGGACAESKLYRS
jgi:hypothetical protein